jgi:hypothetical protein
MGLAAVRIWNRSALRDDVATLPKRGIVASLLGGDDGEATCRGVAMQIQGAERCLSLLDHRSRPWKGECQGRHRRNRIFPHRPWERDVVVVHDCKRRAGTEQSEDLINPSIHQ